MATLPSAGLNYIKTFTKSSNKMPITQKTVHSGWMWKKGSKSQLINRRWFEIKGDTLYYFKDKGDTNVLGQITLAGNEIKRHNSLADSNTGKYCFELIAGIERKDRPVYESHDSLLFGTSTPYEMEEWIKAINRIIYTPDGGGMFGRSLEETIKIDSRRGGGMVPIIVEKCVEYLKDIATHEEGVFRVPGVKDEIELLKQSFNRGQIVDFTQVSYKVNIVASVLKQFIGDLPESVIPPQFYEDFISVDTSAQKEIVVQNYKEILSKIPVDNFNLLKYICRFLHHLQKYDETTKMSISNLAVVFGPNILRPENEDPALLLKSLSNVNATAVLLITHHEDFFPVLDNEYYYKAVEVLVKDETPSKSVFNLLYSTEETSLPDLSLESPSECFLNPNPLKKNDLRRSRSEGNLFKFINNLEETPAKSDKNYYDWTSHLKLQFEEQRLHFQLQIQEIESKLLSEMKIREMLKIRLNDEHKARVAAEERLELYHAGIEEYCRMFGNSDIIIP